MISPTKARKIVRKKQAAKISKMPAITGNCPRGF
jgi:hypothetical protein